MVGRGGRLVVHMKQTAHLDGHATAQKGQVGMSCYKGKSGGGQLWENASPSYSAGETLLHTQWSLCVELQGRELESTSKFCRLRIFASSKSGL